MGEGRIAEGAMVAREEDDVGRCDREAVDHLRRPERHRAPAQTHLLGLHRKVREERISIKMQASKD